ncbi:MAG: GIY-YIG nuclease family protein [Chitinophagales bacterium]|nr:GIY-YIG nuclease family protein [Chitinophagales bacterium]
MFPLMYSIIDIETTGNHAHRHSITEIAVINFDGEKITHRFSSLIKPDTAVPLFISHLTGINSAMLAEAPLFAEMADQILELTEGKILVSHNAHFDYSFLKSAFLAAGKTFQRKTLCTLRLSRQIFPGMNSYSLDRLCRQLEISQSVIHRAEGDALAALELLKLILKEDKKGIVAAQLKKRSGEFNIPPHLSKEKVQLLPDAPGVYYFLDQKQKVLYVGKAKSIRSRVWQHFLSNSSTRVKTKLMNSIHDLRFELCGNELVAMLKESDEIKKHFPPFNVIQKISDNNLGLYCYEDGNGYKRFALKKLKRGDQPLISFSSMLEARSFLKERTREFELCPKLCNLHRSNGACFDYESGLCDGACIGSIPSEDYNERVDAALFAMQTDSLSCVIIGEGRTKKESSVIVMEHGKYLGFGFTDHKKAEGKFSSVKKLIEPYRDNHEVQMIIRSYLQNRNDFKIIFKE